MPLFRCRGKLCHRSGESWGLIPIKHPCVHRSGKLPPVPREALTNLHLQEATRRLWTMASRRAATQSKRGFSKRALDQLGLVLALFIEEKSLHSGWPKGVIKVPLLCSRSEKRAIQRRSNNSERNSLVEDFCGNRPEIGEIYTV